MRVRQILGRIQDPIIRKALEEIMISQVTMEDVRNYVTGTDFGFSQEQTDDGQDDRIRLSEIEGNTRIRIPQPVRGMTDENIDLGG